jgi:hypothetical protein
MSFIKDKNSTKADFPEPPDTSIFYPDFKALPANYRVCWIEGNTIWLSGESPRYSNAMSIALYSSPKMDLIWFSKIWEIIKWLFY